MGVHDFFKIKIHNKKSEFENLVIGEVGEKVKLEKYKNKRLCNDASLQIYQSILSLEHMKVLTDAQGNTTAHINIIFSKILQQAKAGIIQIWIFDSPNLNEMKKKELQKRQERREKADQKVVNNEQEKNQQEKIKYKLNKQHVEDIQFLLKNLGVMYIVAPNGVEAEQYGAFLTKGSETERFCDYMISSDSDVLMFGGNLLRMTAQKTKTGKTKTTIYQEYNLNDVLLELGLTYNELLQVAVLMGTDWNEKAPGIGAATVLKRFKDVYINSAMQNSIDYFKSDISDKVGEANIVNGEYNKENIINFLVEKNFNKDRVEEMLNKYKLYIGKKPKEPKTKTKESKTKESKTKEPKESKSKK